MSHETEKYVRELAPEEWLDSSRFATPYDKLPVNIARQQESYRRGLKVGEQAIEVGINYTGAWYATNRDGSFVSSYECIGYHANTRYFWQGVIDSGVKIVVKRWSANDSIRTVIVRKVDAELIAA